MQPLGHWMFLYVVDINLSNGYFLLQKYTACLFIHNTNFQKITKKVSISYTFYQIVRKETDNEQTMSEGHM